MREDRPDMKICATCQFWRGTRSVNGWRERVVYEDACPSDYCIARRNLPGHYRGCDQYRRWVDLP